MISTSPKNRSQNPSFLMKRMGYQARLLTCQLNNQTTVISMEAQFFWQTPTVLEAIPACAEMTILGI